MMIRQPRIRLLPLLGVVLALILTGGRPVLAQVNNGTILHGPGSPNDQPPGDNPYPPPDAPIPPPNVPYNPNGPNGPTAPTVNAYTYDNLSADATELTKASHHLIRTFRPTPGYYYRSQIDSIYRQLYAFERKSAEFRSQVEAKRNNPPDIENDLRQLVDALNRTRTAFASVRTSRSLQENFRNMETLVGRMTAGTGLQQR